ncbi:MAG: hypothetical protein ACXVPU_10365 [Bacteroidia bacterium]
MQFIKKISVFSYKCNQKGFFADFKGMIFSKKYQIIVSNPCQENWDKMMPVDKGRFCDSCAKKVVDYSILSDKEINERVRNASGNMCGRFRKDQLEKTFRLQPKIQLSSQRRFFQYLLSVLLASKAFINRAIGQTDTIKTEQADSIKSIAKVDSCIVDTAIISEADEAGRKPDSLVLEGKWDPKFEQQCGSEFIVLDSIITITMVSGGMGIQYVDRFKYPSFISPIFDTVKRIAGIKSSNKKEASVLQNDNPAPRKEPVKKEPVVSAAVLPEELKRKLRGKS